MKKIETLIHPLLWDEARSVLETLGVRVTLREVRTFGRTPPRREVYRGSAYFLDVTPELELAVLAEDEQVEPIVRALETVGRQGEILVTTVDGVVSFGAPVAAAAATVAAPSPQPGVVTPRIRAVHV